MSDNDKDESLINERRKEDKHMAKRMDQVEAALVKGNDRMESLETCVQENSATLKTINDGVGGLLDAFNTAHGASKAVIFLGKIGAAGITIYAGWQWAKGHVHQLFS